MYSQRGGVDLQRTIRLVGLFQDHPETCHGPKMARVQRQGLGDVCDRRAKLTFLEIRRGAGIVAFGKIRRVVDQGGKVVDGGRKVPCLHRVTTPLQQQIHRRRS
jgi:hypothetical protein